MISTSTAASCERKDADRRSRISSALCVAIHWSVRFNARASRRAASESLSAMIVQSERFGASLSNALKVHADALRTRRKLRAEAAVAKAGIKMLFPIVLFILPALFVITLAPRLLSVLRDLKSGIGAR